MSVVTVAGLADVLRQHGLLTAEQLKVVTGGIQTRLTDPRLLARELIQRAWLTPYQVNQIFLGRSAELVMGPYLVLERLGEGGTGQVFKARHIRMDRIVALKLIRPELLTDPEVVGRFYREVQVLSRLSHPNVVHAYDAGPLGSTHFLVMEYVEGIDLSRLVKERGPLPMTEACAYLRQAALGLQHAHEKELVHRDVKPSNLFRTSNGEIKVLDLGLARLHKGADGEITQNLTPVGGVAATMGTPDYLAPEQALDFHAVDIRADIYGLGCTLFFLLTGQPPFAGGSMAQKLMRHMQTDPPPLTQFRADAPPALEAVLRRMLAKRPEDRYQTPREVADALGVLAEIDAAPTALPVGPASNGTMPGPRRRTSRRRIAAASAAVLVIGIGLVGFFASRGKETPIADRGSTPPAVPTVPRASVTSARTVPLPPILEFQGRSVVRDVLLDPARPSERLGGVLRDNPVRKTEECGAFLVRFDLSRFDGQGRVQVEKATVKFWVWDSSGKANSKVCAFPVRTAWDEANATWEQPNRGKSWQGGNHFAYGSDTGPPSPHILVAPGDGRELNPPLEYTIDVTGLTQAWLDGTANHGLAIAPVSDRKIDEGWHARFQVYASEHPQTKWTPKLSIWLKP